MSTSILFDRVYNLGEWQLGLVYLPFALSGTISTFCSGWMLDRAYRRARAKRGLSADNVRGDDLLSFTVEKTRIRVMVVPMATIMLCVVGHG
ncbi:hypothetical protein IMZ48_16030 [Candidatus Bathyarchaeota archaeon]|nr:hypothetical protein [Candidatus Bathyarchaeota archaeon]